MPDVSCIFITLSKILMPKQRRRDAYCLRSDRRPFGCLEPECVTTEAALLASHLSECKPYTAGRESTEAWGRVRDNIYRTWHLPLPLLLCTCLNSSLSVCCVPIIRSFAQTSDAETRGSKWACLCVPVASRSQTFPADSIG